MTERTAETAPTRGHKKKARTRRQLLAAAMEVIAERGEAFTIGHVVEQAGVSNGTFYNYFPDRDELIDALVPEVLSAFVEQSAAAVGHTDPVSRFATITALALCRAQVRPGLLRVVLRVDAVQRALIESDVLAHLRADLDEAVAAGRFRLGPSTGAGDAPSDATVDATLDVIVGSMLMAARRIVEGLATTEHPELVVQRLLVSLGLDPSEAESQARIAVAEARLLQYPTNEDLPR